VFRVPSNECSEHIMQGVQIIKQCSERPQEGINNTFYGVFRVPYEGCVDCVTMGVHNDF
jgi:hypothetical protein